MPDVHVFAGHIACHAASQSELVVLLMRENQVVVVLDLASPLLARFGVDDQTGCEKLESMAVTGICLSVQPIDLSS